MRWSKGFMGVLEKETLERWVYRSHIANVANSANNPRDNKLQYPTQPGRIQVYLNKYENATEGYQAIYGSDQGTDEKGILAPVLRLPEGRWRPIDLLLMWRSWAIILKISKVARAVIILPGYQPDLWYHRNLKWRMLTSAAWKFGLSLTEKAMKAWVPVRSGWKCAPSNSEEKLVNWKEGKMSKNTACYAELQRKSPPDIMNMPTFMDMNCPVDQIDPCWVRLPPWLYE